MKRRDDKKDFLQADSPEIRFGHHWGKSKENTLIFSLRRRH